MFSQNDEEQLSRHLQRLISEGGTGNILIVSAGDFYVQFLGGLAEDGIPWLYCESVSNQFLSTELQISEDKVFILMNMGFQYPHPDVAKYGFGSDNFSRYFHFSEEGALINLLEEGALSDVSRKTLFIFSEVYSCPPESTLQFELTLE